MHAPELRFFRDFIQEFKVPDEASPNMSAENEVEDETDLDDGCVPPDEPDESQEMGNPDHEPTDDEIEKVSQAKMAASEALGNGDFETAIVQYSVAIKLMPSALAYANRANAYLQLKRPNAAIKDCDAAIAINPDSAKAYKMRGKAYRMLGK